MMPFISCLCLTYDHPARQSVLEECVYWFSRQDYPRRELVIVNDTPNLEISCDVPGVRVVNVPECKTLGEKYQAGLEACMGTYVAVWDDDDISLPNRLSLAVKSIGNADYFNPRAYWFENGDAIFRHEHRTGYAHNASLFKKQAALDVGGYPACHDPDAQMDRLLMLGGKVAEGDGNPANTTYVYRWGHVPLHISTVKEKPPVSGWPTKITIRPKMVLDYEKKCRDEAEKIAPDDSPELSICIATSDDYSGLHETITSILAHHSECRNRIEIVVCDNSPVGSRHVDLNQKLCNSTESTYVRLDKRFGTACAKNEAVAASRGKWCLLIDSHVQIPGAVVDWDGMAIKQGVLRQALHWVMTRPNDQTLYHGHGYREDIGESTFGTQFKPGFGSFMWGQWETDERRSGQVPFDIWAAGCWLMLFNRQAWETVGGFHPLCLGFGGEEVFIHERWRRSGRKVQCLPWLRASHRFGNPAREPMPIADRIWNNCLMSLECGTPTKEQIVEHFVNEAGVATADQIEAAFEGVQMELSRTPGDGCQFRSDEIRREPCERCGSASATAPIYECSLHHIECTPKRFQKIKFGRELYRSCFDCEWNGENERILT